MQVILYKPSSISFVCGRICCPLVADRFGDEVCILRATSARAAVNFHQGMKARHTQNWLENDDIYDHSSRLTLFTSSNSSDKSPVGTLYREKRLQLKRYCVVAVSSYDVGKMPEDLQ